MSGELYRSEIRMKIAARTRLTLVAFVAAVLIGCAYYPTLQSSRQFERHPGVFIEVWWEYNYDGVAYAVTNLANRSGMDKCAWTDAFGSRRLRSGETWRVGQVQSPGNVGVANVVPSDPDCVNAKREHGSSAR
jgi:hypothetical protein